MMNLLSKTTVDNSSLGPGEATDPRGLRIVTIGGGTGSHNVLMGLKKQPCEITAVVTMSDSGGSSGRLRDELGQLPPGDVRQCLVALAPDERASLLFRNFFNYRFPAGRGLKGHSFGNLFLAVLADITGSMSEAIAEASSILRVQGEVLPVSLTNTTLKARLIDGTEIAGEANLDERKIKPEMPIDYVYLDPTAYVNPPVLEAIESAGAIVFCPGDLYTSIIPNLLVQDVAEAIRSSPATKIYVCNLMTKPGDSHGFKASDFAKTLFEYLGGPHIDYFVVNSATFPEGLVKRYQAMGQHPVELDADECRGLSLNLVEAPLLSEGVYLRHDPDALAARLLQIASENSWSVKARRFHWAEVVGT